MITLFSDTSMNYFPLTVIIQQKFIKYMDVSLMPILSLLLKKTIKITDSKLVIAKMFTLFSESPIVFLGYSFTDENIRNIVADFLSCLTNEQLDNIDEHFVFISFKKGT